MTGIVGSYLDPTHCYPNVITNKFKIIKIYPFKTIKISNKEKKKTVESLTTWSTKVLSIIRNIYI